MAEKKHASYSFRTQPALKAEFERIFEQQKEYSTVTGYFEDCMRALIITVRDGKKIVPPLQFRTENAAG
jgi:hypothetical protein